MHIIDENIDRLMVYLSVNKLGKFALYEAVLCNGPSYQ